MPPPRPRYATTRWRAVARPPRPPPTRLLGTFTVSTSSVSAPYAEKPKADGLPFVSSSSSSSNSAPSRDEGADLAAFWLLDALTLHRSLRNGIVPLVNQRIEHYVQRGNVRLSPSVSNAAQSTEEVYSAPLAQDDVANYEERLNNLAALVNAVVRLPVTPVQNSTDRTPLLTGPAANTRQSRAARNRTASLSTLTEEESRLALPMQDALVVEVLQCVWGWRRSALLSSPTPAHFPPPHAVRTATRWPRQAEANVVVALIVSRRQREDVKSVSLLLSLLLHPGDGGGRGGGGGCSEEEGRFTVWLVRQVERTLREAPKGDAGSCLPWLLFRLSSLPVTDGRFGKEVNRWLASAADCLCAAHWSEIHGDNAVSSQGMNETTVSRSGSPSSSSLTSSPSPFAQFATVLARDNADLDEALWKATLPSASREANDAASSSSSSYSLQELEQWTRWLDPDTDVNTLISTKCALSCSSQDLTRYGVNGFGCYTRLVLGEMLDSAWSSLAALWAAAVQPCGQKVTTAQLSPRDAEYLAVGVYVSLRRILSSLSKHQRLLLILELYELTMGCYPFPRSPTEYADVQESDSTVAGTAAAVMWRERLLSGELSRYGVLLWREVVLFDAFALITLGHTSEHAVDWDDVCATKSSGSSDATHEPRLLSVVYKVQNACMDHLTLLQGGDAAVHDSPGTRARAELLQRLTPRTRNTLCQRLQEGLRLSTKVLLRFGKSDAVRALYIACPAIGGSWDVAKALVQSGQYSEAFVVLEAFLQSTRRTFPAMLPDTIVQTVLRAVSGVVAQKVSDAQRQARAVDTARSDLCEGEHVEAVAQLVLALYEHARASCAPVAPALLFDAALRGILAPLLPNSASSEDVDRNDGDTPADAPSLLSVAACVIQQNVHRYQPNDGLLAHSIEVFIDTWTMKRGEGDVASKETNAQPNVPQFTLPQDVEARVCRAMVDTLICCPHLPVARLCLTRLLRYHHDGVARDILAALVIGPPSTAGRATSRRESKAAVTARDHSSSSSSVVPLFTEAYVEETLRAFPRVALQDLQRVLSQGRASKPSLPTAPDTETETETDLTEHAESASYCASTSNELSAVGAGGERSWQDLRLQSHVSAALQYREEMDAARPPWQCFLCHSWNGRFARRCKLCGSLDIAVVQCKLCNGFTSTTEVNCCICAAPLTRPAAVQSEAASPAPPVATAGEGRGESAVNFAVVASVFPLRVWQCHQCRRENQPEHLFTCASCGTVASSVEKALRRTQYACRCCGERSPTGLARPWCAACGTLSPAATAHAQPAKTLWLCVECHHFNPWYLTHCEVCDGSRPPTEHTPAATAPFITLPWQSLQCSACDTANPVNATTCRGCGAALQPPPSVRKAIQTGWQQWRATVGGSDATHSRDYGVPQGVHTEWVSDEAEPTPEAVETTATQEEELRTRSEQPSSPSLAPRRTCLYCGTVQTNTELCCSHCHAFWPGTAVERWVCVQNCCFHVNVTARSHAGECSSEKANSVMCAGCHQSRDTVLAVTCTANPLQYVTPSQGAASPEGLSLPTALLLTPYAGPRRCEKCGSYHAPTNVSEICVQCGYCPVLTGVHLGAGSSAAAATLPSSLPPRVTSSSGETAIRLWLVLTELHRRLRDFTAGVPDHAAALFVSAEGVTPSSPEAVLKECVQCSVAALIAAPKHLLPWRGCDLTNRWQCTQEPRVMVLGDEDETVHSAIVTVKNIIEALCEVAAMCGPVHRVGGDEVIEPTPSSSSYSSSSSSTSSTQSWDTAQRPWLLAALELVDLVNRTTDYDEIGFTTLARLCLCIRPQEADHIASETRWAYLRDMKLLREEIVHGTRCVRCLKTHCGNCDNVK